MRTELLAKVEHPANEKPPPAAVATEDELRAADRQLKRQLKRLRRLKINVAAWGVGTTLLTALWVVNEWQANGAFERFGHEGDPGQWNPTLWALAIGLWTLIVGIMALRVYFERPATAAEIASEVDRLKPRLTTNGMTTNGAPADSALRRFTRSRLERIRRLKFHVAAWVLGMIMLTPLWALIEWQDNGGFERFSNDSQPGEWEPWVLYIGGIWALVILVFALRVSSEGPETEQERDRAKQVSTHG